MSNPLVDFKYVHKHCDACGADDFEPLWYNEHIAKTRSRQFRFKSNNGICRKCGFVYVNPVPDQKTLLEYYGDNYLIYTGQPRASNLNIRINNLKQVAPVGSAMVEIGANSVTETRADLEQHFSRVDVVEPNSLVEGAYETIYDLPDNTYDLICHYYVLEHVTDVVEFLLQCRRVLKPNGKLHCEVPSIRLYPVYPRDLMFWEHLSQFTPDSLINVAARAGFEVTDLGHARCSDEIGFMATFQKSEHQTAGEQGVSHSLSAYIDAKTLIMEGVDLIQKFEKETEALRDLVVQKVQAGKQVVFYGVNDLLRQLIMPVFNDVVPRSLIIDDNESKKDFFENYQVMTMKQAEQKIEDDAYVLIMNSRLSQILLSKVEAALGRQINDSEYTVYDYPRLSR